MSQNDDPKMAISIGIYSIEGPDMGFMRGVAYMYIYICIMCVIYKMFICKYTHACIYIYTYIYTNRNMYVCIYTHVYMHVICIHVYLCDYLITLSLRTFAKIFQAKTQAAAGSGATWHTWGMQTRGMARPYGPAASKQRDLQHAA